MNENAGPVFHSFFFFPFGPVHGMGARRPYKTGIVAKRTIFYSQRKERIRIKKAKTKLDNEKKSLTG